MNITKRFSMATAIALSIAPLVTSAQSDEDAHHEIDQIVVTATPLRRTVEELAQPTTILRGDALAKKQSTSIGETLSQEPGISSTYFGPVSSRPVIRGQYGERVRVLINGLDSLDASALSEDHQVTVDGILSDRIEIIRGPATLLYGSGAAGGLVNVIDTRLIEQSIDKPFSGAVAAGADTAVGKRDVAVRSHFGSESIAVSFDYFSRSTDNIEIPGFAESAAFIAAEEAEGGEEEEEEEEAFGVVDNTDSRTSGGAVGVSFVGDRGFLGVSFSGFESEYGIPGHHHHEEEEGEHHPGEEEEEHHSEEEEVVRIDLEQTRIDVKGEYDLGGEFVRGVSFRAAVNDYTHTELEGAEVGTVFDVKGSDSRVELRHAFWGDLEGAVGIQYKQIDFDAIGDEAFVPASDTSRLSLFVFEELRLNDSLIFQGSARLENQEITGATLGQQYDDSAFGASIGAVWRVVEDIRISANLALTERHPTTAELYADGPHIAVQRYERGSVVLDNGLLGLEESTNLDLTVHGDTGRIEWSITGFVNSVDNYIILQPTALELDELPVFDYGQADVDFVGVEAQALFELWDLDDSHLHLSVFTDFVNAEEDTSGAYLTRIPPSRVGLGLDGGWNQFDASLDAIFAADQDNVTTNELPTEGYTLLNLSVSYTFDDPDLYLFVRGSNLLNEEIRQHASPLKDLIPLPGRSLHVGLRYEF
jgi:iron complex outermembrane receptor protein